ncbi:competence protein ComM [Variibacter gotjawalensis]|uniref:Competence protein ComM n=1 Tax=Variibacter gotjawalensis TaxID=1333996 RepID=A0A0S3Q0S6_9BRAD|nr:YifB family Mg chelatase-like AAA ATPase [Variibacter gotjawalensis]NIK47621.1 magnesium chelatase family protein [Variibacter gotjawalensis]RZS49518.1 magnesium chelatase family protein [Variibacter gotjawalensis]BAT61781.1 competence protein ComM [Variibacter gotjawalensis]
MVQRVATVAFQGIDARSVDVQVQVAPGMPAFNVVGLADKAVSEARERVRSALVASGLALPARRITVNLAPADLPKEGSHYDLPIALGLMAAIGAIPHDALDGFTVLGELGLDGSLAAVAGVLPAAIAANARDHGLICPSACGAEAAWASPEMEIIAASSLIQLANHFQGTQVLSRPLPRIAEQSNAGMLDLADIKGQENAKRALEVAAAGGHNMLMVGPPGSGKSMLAARLPSILPKLTPAELLEVSMIQSVAGALTSGGLTNSRPFRAPHHSASMAALTGGGLRARPGEISLAHNGVLFLDELPEFQPQVLDAMRQPLESGNVAIARANHRITYPARFMLIAAMNPCRCGRAYDPGFACKRSVNTRCTAEYQGRLSGPLLDRIDLHVEVPAVTAAALILPAPAEGSREVAMRVAQARAMQAERYAALGQPQVRVNAQASGPLLEEIARADASAMKLLHEAADAMRLTARGYHRVLRVARTLADLDEAADLSRLHLAEALSYRALADEVRRAA